MLYSGTPPSMRGTGAAAAPAAASCCSDLREMNEAKVANILSYLDSATAPGVYAKGGGESLRDVHAAHTGMDSTSSAVPLTCSALQHVTGCTDSPSSIPPLPDGWRASSSSPREGLSFAEGGVAMRSGDNTNPNTRASAVPSLGWIIGANSGSGNGVADSSQRTYLGIKKRIERLEFEKEQLTRDNAELQVRLRQWRDEEPKRKADMQAAVQGEVEELQKTLTRERRRVKADTEKAEKLKEELSQRVDALTQKLRDESAQHAEAMRRLESTNAVALSSLRTKWAAQEKASREKWRLAEAKRIKESTLQSLEPDIVLLLNRHKAEKARLREEYENELRQRDEAIAAKDASVEELKAKLRREAEEALRRAQDATRDQLRDESERMQRQQEEERRAEKQKREQLEHHHEDQKRTLQLELDRLGKELLRLQRVQTSEQASFHEAVTNEVRRVTAEANERLSSLKEKLILESAVREREAQEANRVYLRAKEEEVRKSSEIQRDQAITKVVQRLEEEHLRALESARGSDGMLRERYLQVTREKERLQVELDLVHEQLKVALDTNKSKTEELQKVQDMAHLSEQHVTAIEDRIRSEYAKRMSILDQEWQKKLHEFETQHVTEVWELQQRQGSLAQELNRLKSEYEMEKKAAEQRHHAELSQINERVLVAMTRKENTIQHQADQLLALQEAISVRDQELQRHKLLLA